MSKTLRYASALWILGASAAAWGAGCFTGTVDSPGTDGGADATSPLPDAGGGKDSSAATGDGRAPSGDGSAPSDAGAGDVSSSFTYVLIDDLETTTHGPIELAGISAPLNPGYWYNAGASAPGDTAVPPMMSFTFSAVSPPTTTLNGKASTQAAHQVCGLNGQYDVCGIGLEFAQVPAPDAGPGDAAADGALRDGASDAARGDAASDGGDAAPPVPMVTVPFDISQYKGITFWAKTVMADAGSLDIKVGFPDTDTDPRGGVCNGAVAAASGPNDTTQCYNNYSLHKTVTGDWQSFTVLFADLGVESFGYLTPGPWDGKKVYGINWQAQKNSLPDAGTETEDFWIDDVYFIK